MNTSSFSFSFLHLKNRIGNLTGRATNFSGYFGIFWMLFATLLFVSLDSTVKYLVQTYPVPQMVWARYMFHMLFLLLLLRGRIPTVIKTRRLGVQLVRSLLLLGTTALFFTGLRYVPIAEASAIMFVTPIIVTAFSVPLLGERVGLPRWIGVFVGFGGALIILRPGGNMLMLASLLPFGAACVYALYQITTRMLSQSDGPLTTLMYTALVGTLAASFVAPFFWITPDLKGWLLMALTGILGGVGHFSLIKAFQSTQAATITPFGYANLVWATLSGIIFFGEYPDPGTYLGAAVIVGSGLFIFYRERQLARRNVRPT